MKSLKCLKNDDSSIYEFSLFTLWNLLLAIIDVNDMNKDQ